MGMGWSPDVAWRMNGMGKRMGWSPDGAYIEDCSQTRAHRVARRNRDSHLRRGRREGAAMHPHLRLSVKPTVRPSHILTLSMIGDRFLTPTLRTMYVVRICGPLTTPDRARAANSNVGDLASSAHAYMICVTRDIRHVGFSRHAEATMHRGQGEGQA